MTANTELLEQVMQHIEDHPEQHNQGEWADAHPCGTVACFAGWSAILAFGMSVLDNCGGFDLPAPYNAPLPGQNYAPRMSLQAARLLGLTEADAGTLFDAGNTRPMLRLMVKDLVNGEPLRDADEYLAEVSR